MFCVFPTHIFIHCRYFNLNIVDIYKDIVDHHNVDISDHRNIETVIEMDRGTGVQNKNSKISNGKKN